MFCGAICTRGARMELRPPEPGPLRLLPPLGHESSINEYQGLVRRGSSESKRDAKGRGLKTRRLAITSHPKLVSFTSDGERLAGSDAEDDVIDCCGRISAEPDNWALS